MKLNLNIIFCIAVALINASVNATTKSDSSHRSLDGLDSSMFEKGNAAKSGIPGIDAPIDLDKNVTDTNSTYGTLTPAAGQEPVRQVQPHLDTDGKKFNSDFGVLFGLPRISNSHSALPPQTHIAWLEYLGNIYVQSENFAYARIIISHLAQVASNNTKLAEPVNAAVQLIQKRLDDRTECINQPKSTCEAFSASGMLNNVIFNTTLTNDEQTSINSINQLLFDGHLEKAMTSYQDTVAKITKSTPLAGNEQILSNGDKASTMTDPQNRPKVKAQFSQTELVFKLIRFDLENPDNCIPLWRTVCCLDWRMKHKILDTFDLLSTRKTMLARGQDMSKIPSIPAILNRIATIPMVDDITTRILVAVGNVAAWPRIRDMDLNDRYVARACMALNGVPVPENYDQSVEMAKAVGDPIDRNSTEIATNSLTLTNGTVINLSNTFKPISIADVIDSRLGAHKFYHLCLNDSRMPMGAQTRCKEGLDLIHGIAKACPYGGFIRLGLFTQVFGDYLFVKCLTIPAQNVSDRISNMASSPPETASKVSASSTSLAVSTSTAAAAAK